MDVYNVLYSSLWTVSLNEVSSLNIIIPEFGVYSIIYYCIHEDEIFLWKTLIFKYCLGSYLLQVDERIRKVVSFLNKNGYIYLIKKGNIKYFKSTYKPSKTYKKIKRLHLYQIQPDYALPAYKLLHIYTWIYNNYLRILYHYIMLKPYSQCNHAA